MSPVRITMSSMLGYLLVCAHLTSGFHHSHHNLRTSEEPLAGGVPNTQNEVPSAGNVVGDKAGVDIPKQPHEYLWMLAGGGVVGTLITLAIFAVATYYCYKWNNELKEDGQEPACGFKSCLCCCCCTPLVCCFPIDAGKEEFANWEWAEKHSNTPYGALLLGIKPLFKKNEKSESSEKP